LVQGLAWSPDNETVVTVDSELLRLWNVRTGTVEKSASYKDSVGRQMYLTTVTYLPDGTSLLLDGVTRVDARTLEKAPSTGVEVNSSIVLGPIANDGVMIAYSFPRRLYLLNISTGGVREIFKDQDASSSWKKVVGSKDGTRIAGVELEKSLVYADLRSN